MGRLRIFVVYKNKIPYRKWNIYESIGEIFVWYKFPKLRLFLHYSCSSIRQLFFVSCFSYYKNSVLVNIFVWNDW